MGPSLIVNWIPFFRNQTSSQWLMLKRRRRRRRRKKSNPPSRPHPNPQHPSCQVFDQGFDGIIEEEAGSPALGQQCLLHVQPETSGRIQGRLPVDGPRQGRHPQQELDEMINDAPGPINFTMLLTMFAERQSGGSDEDDVVIGAFKSFDDGEGNIDGETLRHALMTWGDKFTSKEVADAFESMVIDGDNKIDCQKLIEMLTAAPVEEDAEAA